MRLKISVDGGGLGAKRGERFGNFVFSKNLIKALFKYDKKNRYFIYTFDKLKPRLAWLKVRLSIEEFKEKKQIFLALNQAIPLYVSGKVISFCHGLAYYFYPKYYSVKDSIRLRNQLDEIILRSKVIIVSSERVKEELESIMVKYQLKKKIIVLPFGIPFDMPATRHPEPFDFTQGELREGSRDQRERYFLYVGMDHPIKNIEFIKKLRKNTRLKIISENLSRQKLRRLYQRAAALLTASHYESFNLPVLEALSQGCPVIGLKSAVIPELEPFVNLAKNQGEFIDLMKEIPKKPDRESIDRLYRRFDWKNYVKKLVELY